MQVQDGDRDRAEQDEEGDRAQHQPQQARRHGGREAVHGDGLGAHPSIFPTVESRGVRRLCAARGEVPERPIGTALKAVVGRPTAGSNPALSAEAIAPRWAQRDVLTEERERSERPRWRVPRHEQGDCATRLGSRGDDLVRVRRRRGRTPARGRLPHRRRDRADGVPRGGAGEAAAGRGSGRRRQDRAGQGGGAGGGRRAGAAAVLRGPRRGPRALRVELQEAAAPDPGQRRRGQRGARPTTTSSPRSSCSPGRC